MIVSDIVEEWSSDQKIPPKVPKNKPWSKVVRLLLEHFQATFNKRFGQGLIDDVQRQPASLLWRYFWVDFKVCNFVIAPAVIAFWRGTWDYSLVYMEHVEYLKVGELNNSWHGSQSKENNPILIFPYFPHRP